MNDVYYGLILLVIVVAIGLAVVTPILYLRDTCNYKPELAPGDIYTVTDNNRTVFMNVITGKC